MATQTFTFSPGTYQLVPVQNPQDARMDAAQFGASLTVSAGQAVARKTSDNLLYPLDASGAGVTSGTNEVQKLNWTNSPAGTFRLKVVDYNGVVQSTQPITYSGTAATLVSNINTALDAVLASAAVVASGSAVTAISLTFSGTNYAGLPQTLVQVDTDALTAGDVDVSRTTAGGIADGTQNFCGFAAMSFKTDSSKKVYFGSEVSSAHPYAMPQTTAPIFTSGIFDPQDLQTRQTPVAEVDTFTAANPTTADVYTITITNPDLSTHTVSATVGATQTATAITTLLKAAWAADATAAAYATATGSTTLILTSAIPGNTLSLAGSVVGTGTISKVVTTATTGRAIADILPGAPGARVLHNGFWDIP